MQTLEDFYDLTDSRKAAFQDDDYTQDKPIEMGISPETSAALAESIEVHHTEVDMKSIQCYNNNFVRNSKVNSTRKSTIAECVSEHRELWL